ncbi:hypothetical protein ASE95_14000 [Sphingomonas sp. Leaf231]|uniref:hypothetical protein n=1 Tax=Sphingomonas sp. Leaf231 TaxID=1736301 RepID=UPI000700A3C6|nr:hypothetical protein [Sphingomonas sp. Leaf231]KQN90569.1 hypothetical protein ASE95_14000 [Sphingomonas sp. Leaf231]
MRTLLVLIGVVALVFLAALLLGFVKFDQTQTAQLPRLEGGQAPKFDADVAKVSVGTENKTVEVPDIDVQKPGDTKR